MLQQSDAMAREIEIKALAACLHAQAALLKITEPDWEQTAIRYHACGILGCNNIESMECPPTAKDR